MTDEKPLQPGEHRRFKILGDGIRFTVERIIKMIKEGGKDPLVIATARKIAALALSGRKLEGEKRLICQLKAVHAWCHENFVFVRDPVDVELIQTPNRMLRELEIPLQLQTAMWEPIGKALGGKKPKPKMTGDSDEAVIISMSLVTALGFSPSRIELGGDGSIIYYAWGSVQLQSVWKDLDILHPEFGAYPPEIKKMSYEMLT